MTFEGKLKFVVYFKQIIKMCPGVSIVDLKQASAGWEAKGFRNSLSSVINLVYELPVSFGKTELRQKCLNTVLFLVCIWTNFTQC